MTDFSTATGQTRTIAALFDTEDQAKRAIDALKDEGVDDGNIDLTRNTDSDTLEASPDRDQGFWHSIKSFFGGDNDDAHLYGEGVRRGRSLVTVRTSDAEADRVVDILDKYDPVDLDENEKSWRSEGWSGRYDAADTTYDNTAVNTIAAERTADRASNSNEQVIPVVEEQLSVGKREVERGNVRVRAYVRDVPVQERVNLRQEDVSVERRPVDQPLGAADAEAFKDRTIEVTARNEEAVVAKNARVTEEVVVRKDVSDRTETVNDTVRKTEVEVDDDRQRADRLHDHPAE